MNLRHKACAMMFYFDATLNLRHKACAMMFYFDATLNLRHKTCAMMFFTCLFWNCWFWNGTHCPILKWHSLSYSEIELTVIFWNSHCPVCYSTTLHYSTTLLYYSFTTNTTTLFSYPLVSTTTVLYCNYHDFMSDLGRNPMYQHLHEWNRLSLGRWLQFDDLWTCDGLVEL
jgi:hypothetical protein